MDRRHKETLQRKRIELVSKLEPSEVYDGLLSRGIFTDDMIDEIKSSGPRRDQARQLVKDLETRGSRAFSAFLECLRETGQHTLADLLENGDSAPEPAPVPVPTNPTIVPLPVLKPVDLKNQDGGDTPTVKDKNPVKPTTLRIVSTRDETPEILRPPRPRSDSIQSYRMEASPCGICLIINNVEFDPNSDLKNRAGSDVDSEKLKSRFKSLNFEVIVKRNVKCKYIKHELSLLAKKDHSAYDCCVVVILSHGTEASHNRFPGAVHGVDGFSVPVQDITNYLNGQKCPSLQGKPKLFFIQACGGNEKDVGFEVSPDEVTHTAVRLDDHVDAIPTSSSSDSLSLSDEVDARTTLPTPSDMLVSYSTFPGYVSWRDTNKGSWYVETLDRILESNANTDDLATMLIMVNNEVSQISAKGLYKQMPGSFNFLRKLVYFQVQKTRDVNDQT
ncbi:caspase-9 [Clarias gariepinus]|uniref:caspase-9 n=1 Tax=Clarias gariepinus TaxID=13013 RepID=UPI00234D469F|nr:caspase-9 [Clarias gariepinus]XP_053338954.1 caspase-9 [Clarias gariepinus]